MSAGLHDGTSGIAAVDMDLDPDIFKHMNITQEAADQATELLKALANRNRLLLLCQLADGEKSVGELAARLGLRDSAVSQQLMLLRKDRLVAPRRDGQTIYYRLASPQAAQLLETLYAIFCSEACPGGARQ